MTTQFLKKPLRVLGSLILLGAIWLVNLFCWGMPSSESYRPKLFNPITAGQAENQPFYYFTLPSFKIENADLLQKAGIDENMEEWKTYLVGVKEADIRNMLYDSYVDYSFTEIFENRSTEAKFLEDYTNLTNIKKANPAAFDYMMFAKKCEYFLKPVQTVDGFSWEETPKDDKETAAKELNRQIKLKDLMLAAKGRYEKAKDPFLKLRYGYQVVTLNRYIANTKENCSSLFDKYIAPLKQQSVVRYWAMLHKASALKGAEADYYYSQVFDNCAAKRRRAFQLYNFSKTDSIALFAKNDKERAAVWAVAALNDGKSLNQLKKVYGFQPNSKHLNLLLVNEIAKLEDWLLSEPFTKFQRETYNFEQDSSYNLEVLKKEDKAYFSQLQQWVQEVIAEHKIENPALWILANAHLYYIDQQWNKAQEQLAIAEKSKGINDDIRKQISITRLLSFALDNGKITPQIEQKIVKDLTTIQRLALPEARKWQQNDLLYNSNGERFDERSDIDNVLVALANRFELQGDIAKAGLLLSRSNHLMRSAKKALNTYGVYDDYFFYFDEFASSKELKKVLDLIEKDSKTTFEYFITTKANVEYYRILDLYGTLLFREGEEAKALEAWKLLPESYWKNGGFDYVRYLNEDPFERNFFNPHNVEKGFFTKPYIVSKILEYKQLVEKEPTQRARYYYLLGNAYYNVSTHGTAWMCTRYGWSGYESLSQDQALRRSDDDNYLRLQNAINYYKKAAEASSDKQFAAFCYRIAEDADKLRDKIDNELTFSAEQYSDATQPKATYVSPFRNTIKADFSEFIDNLINDCGKLQEIENKMR
jgi:hypothetical protein